MDVQRVACRLLDEAVVAFDARGAELYLQSSNMLDPLYTRGRLNGDALMRCSYDMRAHSSVGLCSEPGGVTLRTRTTIAMRSRSPQTQ